MSIPAARWLATTLLTTDCNSCAGYLDRSTPRSAPAVHQHVWSEFCRHCVSSLLRERFASATNDQFRPHTTYSRNVILSVEQCCCLPEICGFHTLGERGIGLCHDSVSVFSPPTSLVKTGKTHDSP